MDVRNVYLGVLLNERERAALDALARETDRSKSAVVRRLLQLAELPEARRLLGQLPECAERELAHE